MIYKNQYGEFMMDNIKKNAMPILKGVLLSLIITLVVILVFAGIIKLTEMKEGTIHLINQIIKVVSVFCGCMFGIKNGKSFVKGIIIGVISMFVAYAIFSILDKRAFFNLSILYEILFGAVTGAICGIITGLFKKSD